MPTRQRFGRRQRLASLSSTRTIWSGLGADTITQPRHDRARHAGAEHAVHIGRAIRSGLQHSARQDGAASKSSSMGSHRRPTRDNDTVRSERRPRQVRASVDRSSAPRIARGWIDPALRYQGSHHRFSRRLGGESAAVLLDSALGRDPGLRRSSTPRQFRVCVRGPS